MINGGNPLNKQYQKIACWILAAYLIIAAGFYLIAHEQLSFDDAETGMVAPSASAAELVAGSRISQRMQTEGNEILTLFVRVATFGRTNTAHLSVAVEDSAGAQLYSSTISAESISDYETLAFPLETPIAIEKGETYYLVLTSEDGAPGNAVTALVGNTYSTGKAEIAQEISQADLATFNGKALGGKLCYKIATRTNLWFGAYYWYFAAGLGLVLTLYLLYLGVVLKKGKENPVITAFLTLKKYSFLIRQLVNRDFKSKYKRSVLGVLWSFLNPLLMMMVQYVVFSTIFRGDIENFPLYLLSGIVTFNFFSESTSVASQAIVANTSLITKVYIPKLIYPVTAVLSSAINLVISFIPLLGVMLITGTWPKPAFLLFPFMVICLFCFCTGVGLILSTLMVFFKDIQFLWGVITMLWMYATPIFYPDTIIPAKLMPIYRLNPLYRFVTFLRTILIEGVSPAPGSYLACLICAVVPLVIGVWIFRKNQDKFIYHL